MADSTELTLSDIGNAIWGYLSNQEAILPHYSATEAYNKELLHNRRLGKEGIQNNPYDRAKNFSGGYDFGFRVNDEDTARDLALIYQKSNALFGGNKVDEMQDFQQNLAGIRAGIEARRKEELFNMDAVLKKAQEYGLLTPLDVSKWR